MTITDEQIKSLTTEQVREAAMHLPPEDREELAEALLASLRDPESEAALEPVLERRFEELRTGKVQGIPAEEVMRRIRERIRR